MEPPSKKRRAESDSRSTSSNKKAKGKKKWNVPRKDAADTRSIQPGDVGIWATCAMKKEAKSVGELRDLFHDYASKLYEADHDDEAADDGESDDGGDIEAEIKREVDDIRRPSERSLFTHIRLDTQCLIFFKTRPPVEPVSFVKAICSDAANGADQKRSRFVKRLTPMTVIGKATDKGIDDVAEQVVAPHFHGPDHAGHKFAIRVSFRNNKMFNRDAVIKKVAAAVGPGHKVDLKDYDLLILVEIYQNICGMSVVGPDFEKLKRYNLAELYEATANSEKDPNNPE